MDTTALSTATQTDITAPRLLWLGSTMGLGDPAGECTVTVKEDGAVAHWSVARALARFNDFSKEAQRRILSDCRFQLQFS